MRRATVIVHGGAGNVPEPSRALHAEGCTRAAQMGLEAAHGVNDATAAALAAVLHAVRALEDDPRYNAGYGACLTAEGTLELDASVMLGADLSVGAVAALPPFANPILIADAVRRDGRHVMYAAHGAARFAREAGFEPSEPDALITDAARERLRDVLAGREVRYWAGNTVGACAWVDGRLAAATSTGGTVAKLPGRIGDTPILGSGTWADDARGACSTTGVGEAIIRFGLARAACERLAEAGAERAARSTIEEFGARVSGSGGLILIDRDGTASQARNTETMSWAIARTSRPIESGY
ncbi:MAG: isoaspartyl peptidase/L-asparaginase [Sandaracinaceae bacterium]